MAHIEKKSKTLVKEYMDTNFVKKDLFTLYKEVFSNYEQYQSTLSTTISQQQFEKLCDDSMKRLNKKRYELDDTAALVYLQHKIVGFEKPLKIKNVVIDEAQDFSIFQLYVLKDILKTNLFTILGDLSQGIHSYRGINDWQQVIDQIFSDTKSNYITLKQSYELL